MNTATQRHRLTRNRGWIDLQLFAMAAVALFSGVLLWWVNESWRESLSSFRPVFSSLLQVRSDTVKGYMGLLRHLAGEPDIRIPDIAALLEQAAARVDDVEKLLKNTEKLILFQSELIISF